MAHLRLYLVNPLQRVPAGDMDCWECASLQSEYERLESRYATAIGNLENNRPFFSSEDYNALRSIADGARFDSEMIRLKIQRHYRKAHL